MTCHVDWPKTLRKASFRGVPFWVEHDSINYGRRIETHEFPNRDRPYQEDLGEKAIDFHVTAYMAGDGVIGQKNALVSACRRRGPGSLVLPTEGSIKVVVFECERSFEKDKLGYIAFNIHFGEAGSSFGIGSSIVLSRMVGIAVANSVPAMAQDFLRNYNVVGEASWVLPTATATIQTWLAHIDEVRLATRMSGAGNTAIAKALSEAYGSAHILAYDGKGLRSQSQNHLDVSALPDRAGGALVRTVADIIADVRLQAENPLEAIEALSTIAAFDVPSDGLGQGISARVEAANTQAINSLGRRFALMELGVAAAEAGFRDRREAVRVRAGMSQGFERELNTAAGDVFYHLETVRGRAAEAISRKVADLQPTIVVESNVSLPSIVWAYRLYGDANRGGELKDRNRVRHPAFMPATFEAEAPETIDEPTRLR